MAGRVSKVISSTAGSCNSKRPTSRTVRVVQISNPSLMIETSASEFRAVVQSLTGRKRPSASGSQYEEMNLYSDNQYSPDQVKVPKLQDGLQTLKDRKTSESALIADNAAETNSCSYRDHCDDRIFEGLEVQPIQFPEYIPSQYQAFDSIESIGDTRHIVFDIFPPSIIF